MTLAKPKAEAATPVKCVRKSVLMLRCSGALLTGLLAVAVITLGLIVISDSDENFAQTASYTIQFPEDEEALKDLSTRLQQQADADALSNIETAAGDVSEDPSNAPLIGNMTELPQQPSAGQ